MKKWQVELIYADLISFSQCVRAENVTDAIAQVDRQAAKDLPENFYKSCHLQKAIADLVGRDSNG